jgi:hypothetical protein
MKKLIILPLFALFMILNNTYTLRYEALDSVVQDIEQGFLDVKRVYKHAPKLLHYEEHANYVFSAYITDFSEQRCSPHTLGTLNYNHTDKTLLLRLIKPEITERGTYPLTKIIGELPLQTLFAEIVAKYEQ